MICSLKENEFLTERITDVDYKDVDYKEIKQKKILSKRKVLILLISILLLIFKMQPKKTCKVEDYLVWTGNEVQLLLETTRDFKVRVW